MSKVYILFIAVFMSFQGSSELAYADDLDRLIDYLVQERKSDRLQGRAGARARLGSKAALEPEDFFRNTESHRADMIRKSEENGALNVSATYYSLVRGPTFYVQLVRPTVGPTIRPTGPAPKVREAFSQVDSLGRIYKRAEATSLSYIDGIKAVAIDSDKGRGKGMIIRFGQDTFLVIRTNDQIPLRTFSDFIKGLPIQDLESAIGA